jgi:predicted MFS family arabinose efflux permease
MKLPARHVGHRIDYLGGILLAVVSTAVILLATWGGTQYGWDSWEIIVLLLITVAGLAAFLAAERRAPEPMLPLHVFRIPNFSVTMALAFFVGLGFFGAVIFLPLFQQTVQGATPTVSGLLMTLLAVGSMVASVLAGQLIFKTGKHRKFLIIGGLVMIVGMFLLSRVSVVTSQWETGIDCVVLGLSFGFLMHTMTATAYNSVSLKDASVASSARMFFQQMGGSIALAAFGAVFASKLDSSKAAVARHGSINPARISSFSPATHPEVISAIANAIHTVFTFMLPGAIVVFVLALFIRQTPLDARKTAERQKQKELLRDIAPW